MKGYFTKKNTEPKKKLKEFRVKNLENYKEGNELGLEIFKDVKFVDIKSTTIGKLRSGEGRPDPGNLALVPPGPEIVGFYRKLIGKGRSG